MHIPKTAGTTLASTLQWNYAPRLTLHQDLLDRPIEDMELIPLERRSSARLLRGHVPYGVHRYIPRRCEYITVLRQPVPRAVSAYKHVLRRPRNELHERVVREGMGLEEFIEACWVGKRVSRQTRQLCNRPVGPVGRSDLEEAKRNLERFLIVGLTERFDETLALVRRALGLRMPFYVTRNVGQPLPVSERAVELIRDREQLDLELYEFASELFEETGGGTGRVLPYGGCGVQGDGTLRADCGSWKDRGISAQVVLCPGRVESSHRRAAPAPTRPSSCRMGTGCPQRSARRPVIRGPAVRSGPPRSFAPHLGRSGE